MKWSPLIAPRRDQTDKAWEGVCEKKPWEYEVQLVIPHLDAIESLRAVIALWQLQTMVPFITVIDTGSKEETLHQLADLECENVEVHCIRARGFNHKAQLVAMAQDVALAVCQSEYQLCTHSDVFPLQQTVCEDFYDLCDYNTPVVGYEISSREHLSDLQGRWGGMVGHTMTMLHVQTIRDHGIQWEISTWLNDTGSLICNEQLDTEIPFNYRLDDAGIRKLIVGPDSNDQRYRTKHYEHCRSHVSKRLYDPSAADSAKSDMDDAIECAVATAELWEADDSNGIG